MVKSSFAVLLLLTINVGNYFVRGQSTVGDCNNDEQDLQHYSDVWFALAKSIQSEFQILKAQISRLENRVERHDTHVNNSLQEIKRQMEVKNGLQGLNQKRSSFRCPNSFNNTANATGFPKCYAVFRQAVDWSTAQQKCRQLHKDAHLAVINGTLEQQTIDKMIQNLNCLGTVHDGEGGSWTDAYYWIGGQLKNISDCSSAFEWKPESGTSMSIGYSNWHPGEPNCAKGIENCLAMRTNGQWNDVGCSSSFCSVCEVMAYV